MLRLVVPTVYCRDPMDEMFGSRCGYFYPPRVVPCRQMNSLMGLSSLVSFVEAMEAMKTCRQDVKDNTCDSCSCRKKKSKPCEGSANKDKCCTTNPKESVKPSSNGQAQTSSPSSPSTSEQPPNNSDQSSEEETVSEAVTVPIERLDDPDSGLFRVSLNLKSFEPEDIEVNRVDNELNVHAKQRVERYGMIYNREIHRSYQLPDDVDAESLKSTLSTTGVLTIEAQRRPRNSDDGSQQSGKDQVGATDVKDTPGEEPESEESMDTPKDEEISEDHQEDSPDDDDTQMKPAEEPGEEGQMDGQTDGQEE